MGKDTVEVYHYTSLLNTQSALAEGLKAAEPRLGADIVKKIQQNQNRNILEFLTRILRSGYVFAQPNGSLLGYGADHGYKTIPLADSSKKRLSVLAIEIDPTEALVQPLQWFGLIANNLDELDLYESGLVRLDDLFTYYTENLVRQGEREDIVWKRQASTDRALPDFVVNPEILVPVNDDGVIDQNLIRHHATQVTSTIAGNTPVSIPVDLVRQQYRH